MSTNDRFGREAPWNFGEFLSKVALGAMLWAIASGGVPGVGSARAPPATAGAQPSVSYLDIFDEIWTTIQNEYYDPAFNGVDWRSARLRYRPRVESAKSPSEAFGYIETLLGELRDSHTKYTPPDGPSRPSRPRGSVGISLAEVEGKTVIVVVEPDSDAARAGVKPGMVLADVNGQTVETVIEKVRGNWRGSSSKAGMATVLFGAILYGGFLGSERAFGIVDFEGKRLAVRVTRRQPFVTPPLVVGRRLPSGYGYLKLDRWDARAGQPFGAELLRLMDAPGLILDLRGNAGGTREAVLEVASHFFSSEVRFWAEKDRSGKVRTYTTHVLDRTYGGPLVVLVDERSASSSEVFASMVQEHGRARLVGRPTCGCVLNAKVRELKAGGALSFSWKTVQSLHGSVLEGVGVTPERLVPLRIEDLRRGRDAAREAAEEVLRTMPRRKSTE